MKRNSQRATNARRLGRTAAPPSGLYLASRAIVPIDADVGDLPTIVDVAAEGEVTRGIAAVLVLGLITILATVACASGCWIRSRGLRSNLKWGQSSMRPSRQQDCRARRCTSTVLLVTQTAFCRRSWLTPPAE